MVTSPSERARPTIAATGRTTPVAEATWLTKTARVRALLRAKIASTTALGAESGRGTAARTYRARAL